MKKEQIPSAYDMACKLTAIAPAQQLIEGQDLHKKDHNGNTFLDCVIENNKYEFLPFCYVQKLYTINGQGICLVDGKNTKDGEISLLHMRWWVNEFLGLLDKQNRVFLSQFEEALLNYGRRAWTQEDIKEAVKIAVLHSKDKNDTQYLEGLLNFFKTIIGDFGSIPKVSKSGMIEIAIVEFGFDVKLLIAKCCDRLDLYSSVLESAGGLTNKVVEFLIAERQVVDIEFMKKYSSSLAFNKYLKFYREVADMTSISTVILLEYKMYDEIMERRKHEYLGLAVEDILKTNNLKFIKEYFSACDDWEKDLALNNYKDGDLEIVKILLEAGAHFIIQGHSTPPSPSDALNPAYQERRDKTKTALTKMQFGIK
ncbi:MAG: hypothetical protein FWC82_04110 [Firmicutes bacterium]|nr:hypothetical protein [Bacillota bacterium]